MTFFNSSIMSDRIFVHTPGVPVGMWTCPHQVLAAILTLSQPGGWADCAQTILVSTPGFESHRRWGNRLCPLHYPQVFRRSYGPAITDSEVVVRRNFILLSFFCCFCCSPLVAEVILFRSEHQNFIKPTNLQYNLCWVA